MRRRSDQAVAQRVGDGMRHLLPEKAVKRRLSKFEEEPF
ncbi:hypothetical protein F4560_002842 [Saccharothrix ecbatanensis]|uniref:Uncharacterized protein n=1 Tax=Saccharothrix ecbatanensis TaxID=1105145 RepID=A0A7W9HIS4_9PSEU|nr:hypothetical protein [Saccharothrix ecbatanensis]